MANKYEAVVYVSGAQVLTLHVLKVDPTSFNNFLISFKNIALYGEIHKTKQDCLDALLSPAYEDRYKEESDIIGQDFIKVKLTQEDTVNLIPGTPLQVQIKFFDDNKEESIITEIQDKIMVREVINNELHEWKK